MTTERRRRRRRRRTSVLMSVCPSDIHRRWVDDANKKTNKIYETFKQKASAKCTKRSTKRRKQKQQQIQFVIVVVVLVVGFECLANPTENYVARGSSLA